MTRKATGILPLPAPNGADGAAMVRFRRAFVRSLHIGHKPTVVERQAIDRACTLTVQAQSAPVDSSINLTDKVRLDNAAARARRDAIAVIEACRRDRPALTLAELGL